MSSKKKAKIELDVDVAEDGTADQGGQVDPQLNEVNKAQEQLEQLNEEAADKVIQIEEEYNRLRKPVYAQRAKAIDNIPDFWWNCMQQHPFLSQQITGEDSEIFTFLRQVSVEFDDFHRSYSIKFTFAENPYFSNKQLEKHFEYQGPQNAEMVCSAPAIHWYPGKDPTRPTNNSGKGKRSRDLESFFLWFPLENEPYESAQDSIADHIKDELWVNPLMYFLGDVGDEEWAGEVEGEEWPEGAAAGDGEDLQEGDDEEEYEGEEYDEEAEQGEEYDDPGEGQEEGYEEGAEGQEGYEEGEEEYGEQEYDEEGQEEYEEEEGDEEGQDEEGLEGEEEDATEEGAKS